MSQAEFASLDKEFEHYQSLVSIRPDSVEIIGHVGSGCRIQITCGQCKKSIERMYYPFKPIKAICPGCGARQDVDNMAFEAVIEDSIRKIFAEYRRVAVWGTGEIAEALFDKSTTLKERNPFVVDSNVNKQSSQFFGCTVCSPHIVSEKQIEAVIIASHSYADEIESRIRKTRSSIKCIKINDLSTF